MLHCPSTHPLLSKNPPLLNCSSWDPPAPLRGSHYCIQSHTLTSHANAARQPGTSSSLLLQETSRVLTAPEVALPAHSQDGSEDSTHLLQVLLMVLLKSFSTLTSTHQHQPNFLELVKTISLQWFLPARIGTAQHTEHLGFESLASTFSLGCLSGEHKAPQIRPSTAQDIIYHQVFRS